MDDDDLSVAMGSGSRAVDPGPLASGTIRSSTAGAAAVPLTGGAAAAAALDRPKGGSSSGRARLTDRLMVTGTGVAAVIPLVALGLMFIVLLVEALPAIKTNGTYFFTGSTWAVGNQYAPPVTTNGVTHPLGAQYGAFPLIIGTLTTSAIALVVGLPIAVGAAILIVEKLPRRIAGAIGLCLEILAGIPSVVIGLWGVLVFGPFLAQHVYPWLSHFPGVFHGSFPPTGAGLLTGGLILAIMIVPIIAATTRDLLRQVPEATKEGAEALGMTHAEAFRTVQFRWVRTGIIAGAVLGLGRALGETIAVAMVCGGFIGVPSNIYGETSTIAATIVLQLDSALADSTGFAVKTLAELALVLLAITLVVNVIARVIVRRVGRETVLPVGAGF
jgi:phosphate transport system permease protein